MAKGESKGGNGAGGGNAKQQPTKARDIENMNEAQIDIEIKNARAEIAKQNKIMGNNDITNTAEAQAMRETFPGGVGGDGWSAQRIKARNKGLERDVKKAKEYTDAYSKKQAAETRLKALENAKSKVAGTDKTMKQIRTEEANKAVKEAPKTLSWKTVQKGGWSNGAYSPKIIKAGSFEIHGSDGLYSIFKDGKFLGRTNKLTTAKAYVEVKKNGKGK